VSTDLHTATAAPLIDPPVAGPDDAAGVDPDRFRAALAHHAAGVVVVTVGDGPYGVTVNSFTSVSLHPPLVSFYLNMGSSCVAPLRRSGWFGVNVLDAGQRELGARFARRGVDRFGPPTRWWSGPAGVPLLAGAVVHLVCRRYRMIPLGDHELVVGMVTDVRAYPAPGSAPLLYQRGRYGCFQPAD
jgi:flavin reductase (DIM6/NTAB) family NADH-FMN oxidoreductase RutF